MALSTEQQMLVEQRLANDKKSTGIAYLLWFFLAGFAAHRFYLGKTGSAIAMLLLFWGGVLLTVIGIGLLMMLAVGVWWIVDAFLIPGIIEADTRERRAQIANEIGALASN